MKLDFANVPEGLGAPVSWLSDAGPGTTLSEGGRALSPAASPQGCWTVLIVDDDQGVHEVTTLVLSGTPVLGRELSFLHAYSSAEAQVILRERADVSLVLLDVVMESDRAGLDLVDYVRNTLRNSFVRIILRTGQPGLAPQMSIVAQYDINGYLEKSSLTSPQLFCAVHTALSTYRDLTALDATQQQLQSALSGVRRSESRFRLLLNSSPIGLCQVAPDGSFTGVNPALCAMLGYSEEELLALTFQDITHPDDLALDLSNLGQLVEGKSDSYRIDKRYLHKCGRIVHVQLDVAALRDEAGTTNGFISQIQSIDERIAAQQRLQALAQRLSLAVRAANIGVWAWDLKSGQLNWDARMYDIYGVPEGTPVSYEDWRNALLPRDVVAAEAVLALAVESHAVSENRFRILHPVHGVRFIEASQEVVLDADNQVIAVVGVNRDETVRRQMEEALLQRQEEIVKLSLTDPLTGVANRRRLDQQLEIETSRLQRHGGALSIAIADLDHFKAINDEFGHEVGDAVLKAFSRTMESHVRDLDLIARLGGEEFVIVMPQGDCKAAQAVAERIRISLSRTLIAPLRRSVTVSFGIAEMQPGESAGALMRRADQALYQAKAAGRNCVAIAVAIRTGTDKQAGSR